MNVRRPSLHSLGGDSLFLSGLDLAELVGAVLAKGLSCRFRARGLSMLPTIRDRDVLTISTLTRFRVRLGAIVAIRQPETGRLVVHRVIAKRADGYLVQGDSAAQPDGLIPFDCVLGVLSKIEREGVPVRLGNDLENLLIAALLRHRFLLPALRRAEQICRLFTPPRATS